MEKMREELKSELPELGPRDRGRPYPKGLRGSGEDVRPFSRALFFSGHSFFARCEGGSGHFDLTRGAGLLL